MKSFDCLKSSYWTSSLLENLLFDVIRYLWISVYLIDRDEGQDVLSRCYFLL